MSDSAAAINATKITQGAMAADCKGSKERVDAVVQVAPGNTIAMSGGVVMALPTTVVTALAATAAAKAATTASVVVVVAAAAVYILPAILLEPAW
jgi:hypothetical protein